MKKIITLFVAFFLYTTIGFAGVIAQVGSSTPINGMTNPTNAGLAYSLTGLWSGTQWVFWNTATGDGFGGGFTASVQNYLFNGTSNDRQREGINIGQALIDNSSNTASVISTNTTTIIKGSGGVLNTVVTSTAGSAWTAAFYNIASGGCTGTPVSGYQFTLLITTLGISPALNHTFPLGICVVTAGTTPGAFSVLAR